MTIRMISARSFAYVSLKYFFRNSFNIFLQNILQHCYIGFKIPPMGLLFPHCTPTSFYESIILYRSTHAYNPGGGVVNAKCSFNKFSTFVNKKSFKVLLFSN